MRNRTAAAVLAGAITVGAGGAAVAVTPASAATSPNPVTSRLARIKSALAGLVGDGTLTQAQADKVASTLDKALPQSGGPGWRGMGGHRGFPGLRNGLDAAAKALHLTPAQLMTELRSGSTLAAVAKQQGVGVDTLVSAIVTAEQAQLKAEVTAGRLTQQQADSIGVGLTQRVTDLVNGGHPGFGRGGFGPRGARPAPSGSATAGTVPSST